MRKYRGKTSWELWEAMAGEMPHPTVLQNIRLLLCEGSDCESDLLAKEDLLRTEVASSLIPPTQTGP